MFDGSKIPAIPFARMGGRFALLLAFAALCGPSAGVAGPLLGAAESFVILGGSSVISIGATFINGDLGVSTGTSSTGATSSNSNLGGSTGAANTGPTSNNSNLGGSTGTSNGGTPSTNGNLDGGTGTSIAGFATSLGSLQNSAPNDVTSQQSQAADIIANNVLNALLCALDTSETHPGGLTLTPGVYCASLSAELNGTTAQNATGGPDAPFVLQIGGGLTTETSASPGTPEAGVNAILGGLGFSGGFAGFENTDAQGGTGFSLFFSDGLSGFEDTDAPGGIGLSLVAAISAEPLPEPSTLVLLGLGLAGLGLGRRRQVPAVWRITSSA